MRHLFALTLGLALSLSLATTHTARAQEPASAETFLRGRHDAVQQLMRRPARGDAATAQRRAQLTEALDR